jgi:hypothetical protein
LSPFSEQLSLALQYWHFSNANQLLIIENQYFSDAKQHLGNAERILALQNWHFINANQDLIIENHNLVLQNNI